MTLNGCFTLNPILRWYVYMALKPGFWSLATCKLVVNVGKL